MQVTVQFDLIPPQFQGRTSGGGQRPPNFLPFHQPPERTCSSMAIQSTPCHKGSINLQTSMLSPGFESRPYETAVSVTNYYIRWSAKYMYTKLSLTDFPCNLLTKYLKLLWLTFILML
ncbi:hypothetical protein TNCV_1021131 [Trichonephila clavipes]|uniref:Uncharacterized protein n=1 Tax=Trichonephila clavipes TaxID=2585209 RepID=A0A8X6VN16_TRICX|nr:hypothetical protein TNCV_1021131 [Trichonephila clavipes]